MFYKAKDELQTLASMDRIEWKLPVNLAIGFHILVFVSAIYLPKLLKPSVKFPEIYSVKLVNIAEPGAELPPPVKLQEPEKIKSKIKEIKVKPVVVKKEIPSTKPKPVVTPVKKAVSIKPLRRKIKKKIKQKPTPSAQEIAKMLQKAKERELQAEKEAQLAAQQVEKIRQQFRKPPKINGGNQTSNISNLLESRYQAQIFSRLQQYWSLTDHKDWDPDLAALVYITIRMDGKVTNQYFEKKSGDRFFDQLVATTLQEAGDMPPIPPALKKRTYKVGLRFKPGTIQ